MLTTAVRDARGTGAVPAPARGLVVHVSPTYFAAESVIGGAERFAEELALAMSRRRPVRLVSFGASARRERPGAGYERVILRAGRRPSPSPFSSGLVRELWDAAVIHCHQYYALPTFLAALVGRVRRRPVFVSDLGGGGWTPAYHVDQSRWLRAHLPISRYAARALPGRNTRHRVIYGGVDPDRYPMRREAAHDGSVVALGRILPHKGLHWLIRAAPPDLRVRIMGPAVDPAYREELGRLAAGKRVEFLHGLDDAQVRHHLQAAMALVHPTPVDADGSAGPRELFGLAVVEAMASGSVAVVSDAASLPELVTDGELGLVVPPNDPAALAGALARLAADTPGWRRLSGGGRARVLRDFTWARVVDRCLDAYEQA